MKPLLTAFFLLMISAALAQPSDLSKPVQLKKGWLRIDAIMQEIYKQGGLKFSFNSQQINSSKKILITNERLSIGAILSQVEETANVKFKVVGRHIVLLNQKKLKPKTATAGKNNSPKTSVKKGSLGKQPRSSTTVKSGRQTKRPATPENTTSNSDKTTTAAAHTLPIVKKTDSVSSFNIKRTPTLSRPLAVDTVPTVRERPVLAVPEPIRTERERHFWISAGATASELSYFNPTIRAGYKRLYGIATIEACSCNPHFQWGVGWELWQDRNWILHQLLTTGTTAALYPAATLPEVLVKNRHFKWSALVSKTVFNRVDVQFGPVVNVLQTRYFSTDAEGHQQKVAAGTLLPETMNGDKVFTATEAPYTLFNTYQKERTANWKGWIGATLNVFYTINFSYKR